MAIRFGGQRRQLRARRVPDGPFVRFGRFASHEGKESAMALLKLAALGALGYVGYKYYQHQKSESAPAFAPGQTNGQNFAKVRDAGPHAMADKPRREWSKTDEESDQSFPASDPPANY
jgi:hypothetical protein